ncbi:hypothetical protein FSP39_019351 [Pinctada imbricata]|uniref:Sacsin/Nov domain-containing protein n=1 Tax=Pinctada imbricata TaxID=66713 RepID=A0AA89C221_PINIB|nr:hypothetical protein FSP39_019351 [Pinctada imbricata]
MSDDENPRASSNINFERTPTAPDENAAFAAFDLFKVYLDKKLNSLKEDIADSSEVKNELILKKLKADSSHKFKYTGNKKQFEFNQEIQSEIDRISPAICFYNDGKFTDEDWEGITMVRKSVKRENPLKVGKFGLGFKSVFHITDYVTVISGRKLLFIDPLKENSNPREVCGFLDLKDVDDFMKVQNSISPLYKLFDIDDQSSKGFPGSLFWFPLRNATSDLSQNVYSLEKCKGLFRSFRNEAPIELLFCKSLE